MAVPDATFDTFYLLVCGALVLFMQAGFAMLEAGVMRSINVRHVLFKNLVDAAAGGIVFWMFGYGLAYGGDNDNGFIGDSSNGGKTSFAFRLDARTYNASVDADVDQAAADGLAYIGYFFQYCFAAAATTIVSGAVAGRTKLVAYLVYSFVITGFVYPVVVHWAWDGQGWISAFNTDDTFEGGVMDFAGSGVVHMVGGIAALIGATSVGPRIGRFDNGPDDPRFAAHSAPLQVLGTSILWFGWYGFNCGSTLGITAPGYSLQAARAALTTTLSAVAGGCTAIAVIRSQSAKDGKWDLGQMCNGILAGLVSITAGCSVVESWAAVIIGMIGGLIVIAASKTLKHFKIDDPLDAFAVHGACGAWGVIAVGLFAHPDYGYNGEGYAGLFYDGKGSCLGVQLLFLLTTIMWVGGVCGLVFGSLRAMNMLRVDEEEELKGMDAYEHESPAYMIEGVKTTKKTGGPQKSGAVVVPEV